MIKLAELRDRISRAARTSVRELWTAILNQMPAGPFLAARRRYETRLVRAPDALPSIALRLAAFRRRIPAEVDVFSLSGRPELRMVNQDSLSTQILFWTGINWVAQFTCGIEVWERLCERASNIIEIGANIGYYTIAGGAATRGRYVAFEPHPRSCAALRRNVLLNRTQRVNVVEAAVVPDSATESVELIVPTGTDRATPAGAMVRGSSFDAHTAAGGSQSIMVKAFPIGAAIRGCDLIKLDVEGLEAALLSAAREEVLSTNPAIMVEIHDHNYGLRALVCQFIAELDARAYAMRRDHLVQVDASSIESGPLLRALGTWDFLIVPGERRAVVEGLLRSRT